MNSRNSCILTDRILSSLDGDVDNELLRYDDDEDEDDISMLTYFSIIPEWLFKVEYFLVSTATLNNYKIIRYNALNPDVWVSAWWRLFCIYVSIIQILTVILMSVIRLALHLMAS